MTYPDISVCVPVWRHHPAPNLTTIANQLSEAVGGLHAELVVVLNGIPRASVQPPPDATVLELDENQGVPIAWNLAARAAHGDTLAFVNDDVTLGPGSLAGLHEVLKSEPLAGAAGPVGTRWDIPNARHLRYEDLDDLPSGDSRDCEVLSGFCFATPKHVYDATKGFDEAYTPCGFEEVDYCTTVRLDLGLRCLAVAGVHVEHHFGISARRPWRRIRYCGRSESLGSIARRNRAHFLSKWSDSRVAG